MNWLVAATIAYFLLALEIVLDKFLLSSKRVSHPAIYAFYSGTMGLFAFVFAPLGFHQIGFGKIFFSFVTGIFFIYGMLFLFFAIRKGEASRVIPVTGAVIPVTIFFLAVFFLKEYFEISKIFGIIALILGGLLISFDFLKEKKQIFFKGFYFSILAGIFLALSATMMKHLYREDNFLNVFMWTRLGAFLGTLGFFLKSSWRAAILGSLLKFKKPEKETKKSGASFVLAKTLGGTGSFLKENATSMAAASVTVVNAMVSLEYIFIFILGLIFSAIMPEVIREKKDTKTILQKISAIIIIAIGIFLVSHTKR